MSSVVGMSWASPGEATLAMVAVVVVVSMVSMVSTVSMMSHVVVLVLSGNVYTTVASGMMKVSYVSLAGVVPMNS